MWMGQRLPTTVLKATKPQQKQPQHHDYTHFPPMMHHSVSDSFDWPPQQHQSLLRSPPI